MIQPAIPLRMPCHLPTRYQFDPPLQPDQLIGAIGFGANAIVFQAIDTQPPRRTLSRDVVVKLIRHNLRTDNYLEGKRIMREIIILRELSYPSSFDQTL